MKLRHFVTVWCSQCRNFGLFQFSKLLIDLGYALSDLTTTKLIKFWMKYLQTFGTTKKTLILIKLRNIIPDLKVWKIVTKESLDRLYFYYYWGVNLPWTYKLFVLTREHSIFTGNWWGRDSVTNTKLWTFKKRKEGNEQSKMHWFIGDCFNVPWKIWYATYQYKFREF